MEQIPTLVSAPTTLTATDLLDFIEDYQFASADEISKVFNMPRVHAERVAGMCGLLGGPACYSLHGDTAEEHLSVLGEGFDPNTPLVAEAPTAASTDPRPGAAKAPKPKSAKADPRPQQRKAPVKRNPKGAVQKVAASAAKQLATQEAAPEPSPTSKAKKANLKQLVESGALPEGAEVTFAYKGVTHSATVLADGLVRHNGLDVKMKTWVLSLTGWKSANVYKLVKTNGRLLDELR